jgi:F-type H+-transporting ATPase subunit gamma
MASARDLRKKIHSIQNTRKITHTMEMVATSKAKRAQDRIKATTPYSERLAELLLNLARAGTVRHPLLAAGAENGPPAGARHKITALLAITGNRGFCGGYNANVLRMAEKLIAEERAAARETEVYMVGRKGIAYFRFLKMKVQQGYTQFDDRPSYKEAAVLAETLMERFLGGAVDRVAAVSTRYLSAGSQKAQALQVLPIEPPPVAAGEKKAGAIEFIFEPDPATILEALLPLSIKTLVYRLLVEAAASEQIARRLAMKLATDNAEEMIRSYTRKYNRSRQAGITQQISEIVGGASALE